jgi:hypothetical protein
MIMSMVIGIWGVVWLSLQLNDMVKFGFFPLPNWHALHKGDSTVHEVPLVVLKPSALESDRLFWWGIPGAAYIYFAVFGTSKDVFSEYTRFWTWFSITVLRRPLPAKEWSMSELRSG